MCYARIAPRPSIQEVYRLMSVDSDRATRLLDSLEQVKNNFSLIDQYSLAFLRFQERHIHDSIPSQTDDSLFQIIEPHFRLISDRNHILMEGLYINGYNNIKRGRYKLGILNILEADTIAVVLDNQLQMNKCRRLLGDVFECLSEYNTANYFYNRMFEPSNACGSTSKGNSNSLLLNTAVENNIGQAYSALWEFNSQQCNLERERSQRVMSSVAVGLPLLLLLGLYSFRQYSKCMVSVKDSRNREKVHSIQILQAIKCQYKELNRLFKILQLSDKSNLANRELVARVMPAISDLKGHTGIATLSAKLDIYTNGLLSEMKAELCLSDDEVAIVIYTAFGFPGLFAAHLMGISDNSFRVRRTRLRKRVFESESRNQQKYLQLITTS